MNRFKNFESSDLNSDQFVNTIAISESCNVSSIFKQILTPFSNLSRSGFDFKIGSKAETIAFFSTNIFNFS